MEPAPQEPRVPSRIVFVVGIDFTEPSEYALALAKNLLMPAGTNAEIHVVHATIPAAAPDTIADALPSLGPGLTSTVEHTRERLVNACIDAGRGTTAHIVPHLVFGDAAAEIAELAREMKADLIVVGARARKGLAIAWHRSLSARLARRASCSVLSARPKELEPEVAIEPPCPDCLTVRRESASEVLWCARHTRHHVHGHLHRGSQPTFVSGSWTFRP
jgi:nucleotide-binding universal stress UspA family protein